MAQGAGNVHGLIGTGGCPDQPVSDRSGVYVWAWDGSGPSPAAPSDPTCRTSSPKPAATSKTLGTRVHLAGPQARGPRIRGAQGTDGAVQGLGRANDVE